MSRFYEVLPYEERLVGWYLGWYALRCTARVSDAWWGWGVGSAKNSVTETVTAHFRY